MKLNFIQNLHHVELLVLDVDGVLTDNSLLITEEGHLLRTMNVKDGYAMSRALREDLKIIIITGGNSEGVIRRLENLGNVDVFSGIHKKLPILQNYCAEHQIQAKNVLYIGDDIPDIPPMKWSGFSACPKDAVPEIKSIAQYICNNAGGHGCVREVVELILKQKGKWSKP